jgi:hypothetical protein
MGRRSSSVGYCSIFAGLDDRDFPDPDDPDDKNPFRFGGEGNGEG